MSRQSLRTDYSADKVYVIPGAMLNNLCRIANESQSKYGLALGFNARGGVVASESRFRPFYMRAAEVTDDSDTCAASAAAHETYDPPCASKNLFVLRKLYYDGGDDEWSLYPEDLQLDASAAYATRQGFFKGERLTAYWDEQRGRNMPVIVPSAYLVVLKSDIGGECIPNIDSAEADVYVRSGSTVSKAQDSDAADITVTVYSAFKDVVAAGTPVIVARDGWGDLWVVAVPCEVC